jgi:DNA-binding NtrC family response regulator
VLCTGDEIRPQDLALGAGPGPTAAAAPAVDVGEFHGRVRAYKQALIRSALQSARGNQTRAAELLGLQRTYLVKLLRSLEIRASGTMGQNGSAHEAD